MDIIKFTQNNKTNFKKKQNITEKNTELQNQNKTIQLFYKNNDETKMKD